MLMGLLSFTQGNDLAKRGPTDEELSCKLTVDLDARIALLTINGKKLELAFSETVTSINYIDFGVQKVDTLFTKPSLIRK